MDLELRPVQGDEIDDLIRLDHLAFGVPARDEDVALNRDFLEPARTLAAFEDGRMVGTSALLTAELTLPGPVVAPMGAVTFVGVVPTHRRRGIFQAMMSELIDEARSSGESLLGLLSSESLLYGRFGFGIATTSASYAIDRHRAAFARLVADDGRLVLLERDEALPVLRGVFERYRRTRAGEVTRSPGWWARHLADPESRRDGTGPRLYVAHLAPGGEPDGYVSYRIEERWDTGSADHELRIHELIAVEPAARLALWRYCLDHDLVGRVTAGYFPLDEPLRWALAEPRRLLTTGRHDVLWVRLLDVAANLASRGYDTAGRLVVEVRDGSLPDAGGRYLLDAGPGGADCGPTSRDADLTLDAGALASLFMGGASAVTLAAAGRVAEHTPGAAALATRLFATDPAPYCDTDF